MRAEIIEDLEGKKGSVNLCYGIREGCLLSVHAKQLGLCFRFLCTCAYPLLILL